VNHTRGGREKVERRGKEGERERGREGERERGREGERERGEGEVPLHFACLIGGLLEIIRKPAGRKIYSDFLVAGNSSCTWEDFRTKKKNGKLVRTQRNDVGAAGGEIRSKNLAMTGVPAPDSPISGSSHESPTCEHHHTKKNITHH
jgi:hypothetical protein